MKILIPRLKEYMENKQPILTMLTLLKDNHFDLEMLEKILV